MVVIKKEPKSGYDGTFMCISPQFYKKPLEPQIAIWVSLDNIKRWQPKLRAHLEREQRGKASFQDRQRARKMQRGLRGSSQKHRRGKRDVEVEGAEKVSGSEAAEPLRMRRIKRNPAFSNTESICGPGGGSF